jgi:hypothetical protein
MSADPRNNGAKTRSAMPVGRPFQPGNPGRPKGSRNKLGEAFLDALHTDWQEHGADAIARVRRERPQDYLKVVAFTLPKDLHVRDARVTDPRELSDEDLAALILNGRDDHETAGRPLRTDH